MGPGLAAAFRLNAWCWRIGRPPRRWEAPMVAAWGPVSTRTHLGLVLDLWGSLRATCPWWVFPRALQRWPHLKASALLADPRPWGTFSGFVVDGPDGRRRERRITSESRGFGYRPPHAAGLAAYTASSAALWMFLIVCSLGLGCAACQHPTKVSGVRPNAERSGRTCAESAHLAQGQGVSSRGSRRRTCRPPSQRK